MHALEEQGGEEKHATVVKTLASSITCQIGHATAPVARGKWEGFPHWPYEVTYNASGYGPYQFWTLGGGSGGKLSGPGTPITTYWSAGKNAERLDHASCDMAGVGHKDGVPCTHLFVNGSWAFLYSQDEQLHYRYITVTLPLHYRYITFLYSQDEQFCCMSSAPEQYDKCHLTRPQRNFMDVFNYDGEIDYTSEDGLYTGKAKKYSMHLSQPSNFWFWYVTDMEGAPRSGHLQKRKRPPPQNSGRQTTP